MKLAGKKALITGGNSGIGLATAFRFIKEGAQVAITGRNQETLDAAVAQLGPNAIGFRGDIADSASRKAILKQVGEKFGKLDIVFANAGIPGSTPVGKTPEELFEQIISVNLTSVFFTVQDALPTSTTAPPSSSTALSSAPSASPVTRPTPPPRQESAPSPALSPPISLHATSASTL